MDTFEFHEIVKENLALAKQHSLRIYQNLCDAYIGKDMDEILRISEELSDLMVDAHRAA